ncbi:MAG: pyridoxal-phosphate dependent enzyme [Planctomycetaceae bacterium]|nr:pyridoxal-phosphate dependent enzyme [Planctomycetaceae bacterium]
MDDVRAAEQIIRQHISPAPLIRSYALKRALGLPEHRRVWLKDYGWTPVGSFKLLGALNWVANHLSELNDRPIAAHSSGNFAAGISYAGMRYGKRVIIVMPDTAPETKFRLTRSFGAEIRTYNIARDHETGERDALTKQIADVEHALQASPYDDPFVIAGNGVGGLEIAQTLQATGRTVSHFLCSVSGGGLMAGHALAMHDAFPAAQLIGIEPATANDYQQSLAAGDRVRIERPTGICDGLLSYDVGENNWPILKELVPVCVTVTDQQTTSAMRWIYEHCGLGTEPSGAVGVAAAISSTVDFHGEGDIVIVVSGRNVDEPAFRNWITATE